MNTQPSAAAILDALRQIQGDPMPAVAVESFLGASQAEAVVTF